MEMARARKSTMDAALDQFSDWDSDQQEKFIDTAQLLHRQTVRREGREKPAAPQLDLREPAQKAEP